MSIGSKFYKRFGLKFVLAYRIRKTKRKILREVWIQKILMFYGILKLQRDFKAFKIYQTLREQNTLIVNPKNLQFIISYYDIILQWLNSKEFKEQYITTNHPYPPLLNPKRLNVKESHFKDFIVSASDCFDLDLCSKGKFADTESRNDESQSKSIDSIQPYPNLSYESIPAELAWDLNLPLPRGYKMIYLYGHGAGVAKVSEVFSAIGLRIIDLFIKGSANNRYILAYNFLLHSNGFNVVSLSDLEYQTSNYLKFFSLIDKKVSFMCQTRDPMELLRHCLARAGRWTHSLAITKEFDKTFDFEDVIKPLEHLKYNYNLEGLKKYAYSNLFSFHIHFKELQKNISKIAFLDIKELNSDEAISKLQVIAKDFGFNPPQNCHKKALQTNVFKGSAYLFFPLVFQAGDFKLTLATHSNNSQWVDLHQEIMGKPNEVIGVYIDKNEVESFRANETLYKESCEYLKKFLEKLKERFKQEDAKALAIRDIMQYFKQEPQARKHIKSILDKEVAAIAQYRPDIVESWKYYQEFERMCEEMDK
ncbi:DUF2972 domain-containing protein [Helicobacter sp. UBA3407]|uniref:DUF2972 domain-containing protein n=1 Tax=Helicobacter sp. UBA3407 TaxID=1946588 RepID=UPI002639A24B|nr:DUF2972 domain-containing protein [Helicobacter sp. UBA3407]